MDNDFHTSTSDDGVWDSGILNLTQFTFRFTAAGDYPYHCTTHTFMTASVSVTASSNQSPVVSITSPTNGASFTAPALVPIDANASDPDGSVTNVGFFDGAIFLGGASQSPYTVTATLGAGVHPLTAVATDNLGLSATSSVVSVTISAANSPPSVTITNPADHAVFGNTDSVAVRVSAADSDGSVTNVQLFNGNVLLRSFSAAPFNFTGTAIAGSFFLGTNTLIAVATDNLGARATSAPVNVVISRYLAPIPIGSIAITLLPVATGLAAPDYGISPPGDKTRLFVLEQNGLIRVIENGVLSPTPALDIQSRVQPPLNAANPNDERGLLGIAFHPGYTNLASAGYRTVYTYNSEMIPAAFR